MAGLNREELIGLVSFLMNPRPGGSDAEREHVMQRIVDAVPDPNVIDYIFWDDSGMTPEQIVDKALAYRPIAL